MENGRFVGLVLLVVGAVLLYYGVKADGSFSSGLSQLFDGAPSTKTILLLAGGALLAAFGVAKLSRRSAT